MPVPGAISLGLSHLLYSALQIQFSQPLRTLISTPTAQQDCYTLPGLLFPALKFRKWKVAVYSSFIFLLSQVTQSWTSSCLMPKNNSFCIYFRSNLIVCNEQASPVTVTVLCSGFNLSLKFKCVKTIIWGGLFPKSTCSSYILTLNKLVTEAFILEILRSL